MRKAAYISLLAITLLGMTGCFYEVRDPDGHYHRHWGWHHHHDDDAVVVIHND